MKKILFFMLLSLIIVSDVYTQDEKKIELTLGGGLSIPLNPNDFSDYWTAGFNGVAGLGFEISEGVIISGSIGYNIFPLNEDEFLKDAGLSNSGISTEGGSTSILFLSANFKGVLTPSSKSARPYLTGGIGYFNLGFDEIKITDGTNSISFDSESEGAFGLSGAGGIEFPVSNNTLIFVEVGYLRGLTEGDNTAIIFGRGGINLRL